MQPVELVKSYRLLNHGPTVLVTSRHGQRRNVMAAAWSMPLDYDPPKVAVVIERGSLTRELVDASQSFALNVPVRGQAALTLKVGNESGRDGDKFEKHAIVTRDGPQLGLPLVNGCAAWLECRVIPERKIEEAYDLFLGEIVGAWADPRAFSQGHWNPQLPEDLHTLHYIAGGNFFLNSESLVVK